MSRSKTSRKWRGLGKSTLNVPPSATGAAEEEDESSGIGVGDAGGDTDEGGGTGRTGDGNAAAGGGTGRTGAGNAAAGGGTGRTGGGGAISAGGAGGIGSSPKASSAVETDSDRVAAVPGGPGGTTLGISSRTSSSAVRKRTPMPDWVTRAISPRTLRAWATTPSMTKPRSPWISTRRRVPPGRGLLVPTNIPVSEMFVVKPV